MNSPKGTNSLNNKKNTKIASPVELLKQQIQTQKQRLNYLKNVQNVQLLTRLRKLQKQIQRLQIVNVEENSYEANKMLLAQFAMGGNVDSQQGNKTAIKLGFVKQASGLPFCRNSQMPTQKLSNIEQLDVLKNITTKSYCQDSSSVPNQQEGMPIHKHQFSSQLSLFAQRQFAPGQQIRQLSQRLLPTVTQSQTYPLLNRYLASKSALVSKLIQLNPQKRNNNSLLVSHQRVMLKQHLDMTRRIVEDINKKNEELQNQLNKDFVMVRNKWQESQRELRKMANAKQQQSK